MDATKWRWAAGPSWTSSIFKPFAMHDLPIVGLDFAALSHVWPWPWPWHYNGSPFFSFFSFVWFQVSESQTIDGEPATQSCTQNTKNLLELIQWYTCRDDVAVGGWRSIIVQTVCALVLRLWYGWQKQAAERRDVLGDRMMHCWMERLPFCFD